MFSQDHNQSQSECCTLELLAALLRWEVVTFSWGIDHEALNVLSRFGRHRFLVLRARAIDAA